MSDARGHDDVASDGTDQTNETVGGLLGESDGTLAGEEQSAADRATAGDGQVFQGQQDVFQEDHYGTEEGTDPNP